jgi:hypothetical protein
MCVAGSPAVPGFKGRATPNRVRPDRRFYQDATTSSAEI